MGRRDRADVYDNHHQARLTVCGTARCLWTPPAELFLFAADPRRYRRPPPEAAAGSKEKALVDLRGCRPPTPPQYRTGRHTPLTLWEYHRRRHTLEGWHADHSSLLHFPSLLRQKDKNTKTN